MLRYSPFVICRELLVRSFSVNAVLVGILWLRFDCLERRDGLSSWTPSTLHAHNLIIGPGSERRDGRSFWTPFILYILSL